MRSEFEIFLNDKLRELLNDDYLIGYDLIEVQTIIEKYYFELDTIANREKIINEILNSKAIKKYKRRKKLKKLNENIIL